MSFWLATALLWLVVVPAMVAAAAGTRSRSASRPRSRAPRRVREGAGEIIRHVGAQDDPARRPPA